VPKVLIDGQYVEVGTDAIFNDDGQTPFVNPSLSQTAVQGRVFTEEDVARIRQEEKDKVYGRLDAVQQELASFKEQVGSLTAAEQRRQAQLKDEEARLEAEAREKETEELDAKSLLAKREQEWRDEQARLQQEWESRFESIELERKNAEALAQREREFNDLKDYAQSQVEAHKDDIAPQLLPWITGNSREEIDTAIARAVQTTASLTEEMQAVIGQTQQVDPATGQVIQQPAFTPAPPATPGTRVSAPVGADPAAQFQTLTPEQIANMPMDQYAKLRGTLGIGGQSQNRGLYG
jgi:hypothetical protein